MGSSHWSRLLYLLTLIGATLTLGSWLGPVGRTILYVVVAVFVIQAVPIYCLSVVAYGRRRQRAIDSIEDIGGKITGRWAGDPACILEVDLSEADIDELDWHAFAAMTQLVTLNLRGQQLTRDQIETLTELPRLRELDLSESNITDDTLVLLARTASLDTLDVTNTEVTEDGILQLWTVRRHLDISAKHLARTTSNVDFLREVSQDAGL